jgi:hypothetical protein
MILLASLWLPILVAAVAVFFASSLIHMVFKWHQPDYGVLANEDQVGAALRAGSPAPGMYMLPHCKEMKDMGTPAMQEKFKQGPVGLLVLRAPGMPGMGKSLGQWFALNLVVAVIGAHLAGHSIPGADFHHIFHFAALVTFLTYGGGSIQSAIWMGMPWRAVLKDLLDALIYGLLSGLVFAWLWPH